MWLVWFFFSSLFGVHCFAKIMLPMLNLAINYGFHGLFLKHTEQCNDVKRFFLFVSFIYEKHVPRGSRPCQKVWIYEAHLIICSLWYYYCNYYLFLHTFQLFFITSLESLFLQLLSHLSKQNIYELDNFELFLILLSLAREY